MRLESTLRRTGTTVAYGLAGAIAGIAIVAVPPYLRRIDTA
jgi:hypothetical protein